MKKKSAIGRAIQWFSRITGFSTPFGGLSWSPPESKHDDVPIFDGPILLTSDGNDAFISFLDKNSGKIIFLDSVFDASVAIQDQIAFVEVENLDLELLTSGNFDGISYLLQNNLGKLVYVAFHFAENHVLNVSHGGTGTIMVPVTGFFEVSPSLHGGPSVVFHLKEIEAQLEARLAFLNKSSKQP
jgi:hypothetical protein